MVWRCSLVTAACVAAVSVLALLPVSQARAAAGPPWVTPGAAAQDALFFHPQGRAQAGGPLAAGSSAGGSRAGSSGAGSSGAGGSRAASSRAAGSLAGCEQKLIRARSVPGAHPPVLAIVGASFTAGVGPGNPDKAWAVRLTRTLSWDAVIDSVPGAGYVRLGVGRTGPMAAEITRVDLRALDPELVIVQAGHDDIGVPASLERLRVTQAITTIRAQAPRAQIALLTVFPGRKNLTGARRTDQVIVAAGKAADRQVIIMDPLTGDWQYARVRAGLHPTASGDAWIAARVARILGEHGVRPQPAGSAGGAICDSGIDVPAPSVAVIGPR